MTKKKKTKKEERKLVMQHVNFLPLKAAPKFFQPPVIAVFLNFSSVVWWRPKSPSKTLDKNKKVFCSFFAD